MEETWNLSSWPFSEFFISFCVELSELALAFVSCWLSALTSCHAHGPLSPLTHRFRHIFQRGSWVPLCLQLAATFNKLGKHFFLQAFCSAGSKVTHTHSLSLSDLYRDVRKIGSREKLELEWRVKKGKFYNQTQIETVKWRIVLQNTWPGSEKFWPTNCRVLCTAIWWDFILMSCFHVIFIGPISGVLIRSHEMARDGLLAKGCPSKESGGKSHIIIAAASALDAN